MTPQIKALAKLLSTLLDLNQALVNKIEALEIRVRDQAKELKALTKQLETHGHENYVRNSRDL